MQKNELIRAWIFLVIFWWMMAWAGYGYQQFVDWVGFWSDVALLHLSSWIGLDITIPQPQGQENGMESLRVPDSFDDARDMMTRLASEHWTMLGFGVLSLSLLVGVLLSIVIHAARAKSEERVIRPGTGWRGITLSIGDLPLPVWKVTPPKLKGKGFSFRELTGDDRFSEQFQKMFDDLPAAHRNVLADVLLLLKDNKSAPVGKGHAPDTENGEYLLLEHTLRVMEMGWKDNTDPLLPLALAAHDLGKIRIWDAKGFPLAGHVWSDKGYHDERGAMMIGALDSMDLMPDADKQILPIVVRYSHKPWALPLFPSDELNDRAHKLLEEVRNADHGTTKQEKTEIIEKTPEEIYIDAFIETLKSIRWNAPSTPRKTKNQGWRKGNLVCLLEPDFREIYVQHLPEDLAAALGNGYRAPGKPAQATRHLMDLLKSKGWLLTVYRGVDAHESGLWYMDSGMKRGGFQGVIALDLPDEMLFMPETGHEIQLGIYNTDKPIRFEGDPLPTKEEKAVIAMSALYGVPTNAVKRTSNRNKRLIQAAAGESGGQPKEQLLGDQEKNRTAQKLKQLQNLNPAQSDGADAAQERGRAEKRPTVPAVEIKTEKAGVGSLDPKKPNRGPSAASQATSGDAITVDDSMYDIF